MLNLYVIKKICFVVYDIEVVGGIEIVTKNLSQELKKDYVVYIYSFANSKNHEENGVLYRGSNSIRFRNRLKDFSRFLKKEKIKIVLLQGRPDSLLFLAKIFNPSITFFACAHSCLRMYSENKHAMFHQKLQYCFCKKIIVLNSANKKLYDYYFGHHKKTIIIPNFIPLNHLTPATYNSDSKKIICVTRLSKEKGALRIPDICKPVFEKHPDWSLDIYGDGNLKNNLIESINRSNLSNNIHLKGEVANLNDIYNQYSFLILTSNIEGQPLCLMEWLAHNLPLISFDIECGPSDIIRYNINGFLIKPFDLNNYSNKMNYLIENKLERISFSKNEQELKKQFDVAEIIKKWEILFENSQNKK